jgi:hypothetical protein
LNVQSERSWVKSALVAFMMSALFAFTAAPRVHADERSHCQHAIEKAEVRLDEAVAKHGERSHEAEVRRSELNTERERCWAAHHEWWNGKDHQWHNEHW